MMKRKFIPGSEWLYLKIYTGVKTCDIILEEALQPLIEYFQENKYISKWFFIRYNDPKPHLRIRFKLDNIDDYSKILKRTKEVLQNYIESGEVSNIVIDTYNREIERYGENTIQHAETLFYINSEYALQCLCYDDEEKIIVSIFYIDELLNKLNFSVQEKLDWIKDFNITFKKEFNTDKKLSSQLDKKYRDFKPKLIDFLTSEEFLEERNTILFNIEKSNPVIQNIIFHCEGQTLQSFFQSIFHMNINRIFVSYQRLFEMLIYDYLVRYYKMKLYIP
ncbi:thiopeptide-type bacteriocin biosynthesis protein [Chryseobacterium sp. Mn2064]|uniref:thiopeptide-type bacteriocin biosynthesis protein n=1 Tax=Chryseobacterium sp. Mn2064 TaxID=3395263 RepID=UPI003BE5929C